ncbi:MAG: monovalent cation/H+ antiporter subunit D family protein [Actinotalea sp.]|nr:monovalent cation/H+ antiporter subunit D family protein [Actinotalea sp.]
MAGVTLAVGGRVVLQRVLALGTHAAVVAFGIAIVVATRDGEVIAEQVAGWPGGISIPFAVDVFAGLMITVAAFLVLVSSVFGIGTRDDADRYFHPLVLVLTGGVYGAFATADLFNLFVMIEVALVPSYVLLTRSGRMPQLGAGRVYLTVNLLVSTILLSGVGLVYATAGTVNLGELAGAAQESVPVALAGGVVLVALGAKAALVPVHSWLPRSYPFASVAVTALLSGLLTKIGVYWIFRLYAVMFGGDERLHTAWLWVLGATMVVGVLGALGESGMRAILSFHMTSQVGYILLGIGFFGPLGLAAGIFYLIHHIIVKAALFLACGAVEHQAGTGRLSKLGGAARHSPWLALVFLGAALSLVGIPPFSGFVAKLTLVRAAVFESEYLVAGLAVAVSLFTLLSMLKIWNGAFWGQDPAPVRQVALVSGQTESLPDVTDPTGEAIPAPGVERAPHPLRVPWRLVLPGAVLTLLSLSIGLGADVLLSLAQTAAEGLVDPTRYVEAVTR